MKNLANVTLDHGLSHYKTDADQKFILSLLPSRVCSSINIIQLKRFTRIASNLFVFRDRENLLNPGEVLSHDPDSWRDCMRGLEQAVWIDDFLNRKQNQALMRASSKMRSFGRKKNFFEVHSHRFQTVHGLEVKPGLKAFLLPMMEPHPRNPDYWRDNIEDLSQICSDVVARGPKPFPPKRFTDQKQRAERVTKPTSSTAIIFCFSQRKPRVPTTESVSLKKFRKDEGKVKVREDELAVLLLLEVDYSSDLFE